MFRILRSLRLPGCICRRKLCATFFALILAGSIEAQDHTIVFSTSDPGVSAGTTNWGLDTCWPSFDNMQRGLIYMGTNNVTIVRVGFFVDAPLTNNDVTLGDKSNMQTDINLAGMATAATRWDMNLDSGVNSWYESAANVVYPDRWAAAMEACQRYYNRNFWSVEGFNEPDYTPNGEGTAQNLDDIFGYLQASTNFPGTYMSGGSTLDDDVALSWFDPSAARASLGTTHCLAGSASSYVNFIQSVTASNAMAFNPEMHNVMEAIMGINYGLTGGIWWGTAELARGSFVNACQGRRLGYADDLTKWTAAAVYRAPGGAEQAFVGASERMATTTSYRFFARDRNVFYDGYGPQRDYTVVIPGGTGYQVNQPDAEKLVNITWGADIQPAINGRYILVNCKSHLVLEVPGGSTANGVQLDQNIYAGQLYQQWNVNPMPSTSGGDYSYFSITAAHDGVNADLNNFSYANGGQVQQWNGGTNLVEQWYFQYTTNGYFKIRNRWSNKVIGVNGASTSSGAQIVQWDDTGSPDQQWRLIPATVSTYDFVAPAAPTGVTATANAVSVRLNWNKNTESDFASYTVLRATNSSGPYEVCARGLTSNTLTDNSANQPEPYFYVVEAVDRSLNTSSYSAGASATPTGGPALVAFYPMEGNVSDSSGNSNNATIIGTQAYVSGPVGSAISLDGVTNYLEVPADMANFTNFTIAAWVFWNGGAAWQRIFDFGNDTTQYMLLTPNSGNGTLRFAITTNGAAGEQIVQTTAPMISGQWIHVAVTGNGNIVSLYVNGMLAASGSVTLNPAVFNPVLNYFGKSQYADPLFSGDLDEVLVANYAMNETQIAGLMGSPMPLPALVHRYSFNETGGTIIHDSIGGSGGNGTLPNGGAFNGGRLALSAASSQYINLPADILSNYTAVTIEAWATFPDQIPWNTMFFAFGDTNGASGDSYIFCAPQGGRIAVTATNYTGEQNAYSGIDFSFHTNLHVTAVYNPPANYLAIYTNGVLSGVNSSVTVPLNVVSNVFSYVGRSLYSGDTYFDVSLDELRIYNGAMQPADVAAAQLVGPNVLLTTNVSLNTINSGGSLTMSWPVTGSGFTLLSSPTLGSGAVWTPVSLTPSIVGANNRLTVNPTNGPMFFRLQR